MDEKEAGILVRKIENLMNAVGGLADALLNMVVEKCMVSVRDNITYVNPYGMGTATLDALGVLEIIGFAKKDSDTSWQVRYDGEDKFIEVKE